MDLNTPISELTVGELITLIGETIGHNQTQTSHGVQGIADLFGVSYSQAKRIKASGIIDKAICQQGRTIIVNNALALELFGAKGRKA